MPDSTPPTNFELALRLTELEGTVKIQREEYRTDIARLAADMAQRDAGWRADIDRRDKEAIQREAIRDKWLHGILISLLAAVIAGTIVGIILILTGK